MLYFLKELFIYVGHLIKNTFIRRVLKALMWILIVLLLIPALLYVPFVQDFGQGHRLEGGVEKHRHDYRGRPVQAEMAVTAAA